MPPTFVASVSNPPHPTPPPGGYVSILGFVLISSFMLYISTISPKYIFVTNLLLKLGLCLKILLIFTSKGRIDQIKHSASC